MFEDLKATGGKYLLAVSGGIDSMAMASMFLDANIDVGVAHCNFALRGQESDDDEDFVRNFALNHKLSFHPARFDTAEYAYIHGLSIQQAARKLRYEWFETLQQEYSYRKVAVAHNADDKLETFFINLLRGAGLGGLTGIAAETKSIVRPLINMSRKQIEEYVREHGLSFREDSSNKSDKYLRNRLRHFVLPVLDEVNPAFREKTNESLKYLKQAHDFVVSTVEKIAQDVCDQRGENCFISIKLLEQYADSLEFIAFQLLEPFGFKREIIGEIIRSLKGESGKQFLSDGYLLVKDREFLIISPRDILPDEATVIDKAALPATVGGIQCEIIIRTADFTPEVSSAIGQLDADKLQFPLVLRAAKSGDRFVPFGMKGFKKLSDFFIDNKISVTDKRKQYVIVSGEDIVWIVGRRIDDRYRITNQTKKIFRMSRKSQNEPS
ncbi:MAG: tRNA lysidine(34) synthetase TilS [Prevotellaceae bacterium]|jgi:tRNA(Ile)-lysidine synthase|nr:tRNA lysidine(34) synthetase TilS [Prevotellaceae bacterium]